MEDSKNNCGLAQSSECVHVSQPNNSKSSPSSGAQVKVGSRPAPGHSLFAHRHLAMAPQQPALKGGHSHFSNQHGAWASTPVWEHAPNISETMEGASADFNGGRSLEWDVKGSPWEWESMGVVYPARRGADALKSSVGRVQSPESGGSMGFTAASPASNRSSFPKNGAGATRDSPVGEVGKVRNVGGDDQRASQGSVVNIEQQRRLFLGLGETVAGSVERRKSSGHEQTNGVGAKVGGGDSLIGLKLGRRTYFEDAGGGGRGVGGAVFAVCPPGKKPRVQSPGVQLPRCQVEGCKQDLSSSKDYHRRHKVCEMHSKAAKVIAAGYEQRFCQQCSRFHVLTEFDEGKRSCRRRLAGHNERRRKPQPESAAIVSTGTSTAFHNECGSHATSINGEEDNRGTNGLAERACFMPIQRTPGSSSTSVEDSDDQSGSLGNNFKLNQGKGPWPVIGRAVDSSGLACQLQGACGERQPFISSTADRLLMLLQSPKGQITGAGVHEFMLEGSGSMGPGLTLASSSGPASVLSALDAPTSPSVSGISDSGRALSLLSSQAWGSRGGASCSVSLDVSSQSDVTLEQLISENSRSPFSPRGPPSHFHGSASGNAEKLFRIQAHSPRDLGLSTISRVESREQHRGFLSGLGMVGSYESHTMLAVMQGQSEFRGIQGSGNAAQRPTIDLMQLPSPQPHGQFSEFSALRPFESTIFDSQQML